MLAFDAFQKWSIHAIGHHDFTRRGKYYILTIVDYLSHWPEAKAVNFVYEDVCYRHGIPLQLLSDKVKVFMESRWITYVQNL